MIKIHKKLTVIHKNQKSTDKLVYMTHKETNAAYEKRFKTGSTWAGYMNTELKDINYIDFDNTLISGFKIIDTATRYSTSNKFFRVEDPRGFVVEISTEHIFTILQNTTIINGEIQDECLWGMDKGHILLPKNSKLFTDTLKSIDEFNNLLTLKDLTSGDKLKLFGSAGESTYLGKAIITYNVVLSQYYTSNNRPKPADIEIDTPYVDIVRPFFISHGSYIENTLPKIVSITGKSKTLKTDRNKVNNSNISYKVNKLCEHYATPYNTNNNNSFYDRKQVVLTIKSIEWLD